MATKEDVAQLRQRLPDNMVMDVLYDQDTEFRYRVDQYKTKLPEASEFLKAKFPSAVLNKHYYGKYEIEPQKNTTTHDMVKTMIGRKDLPQNEIQQPEKGFADDVMSNLIPSGKQLVKDVGTGLINVFNPNPEENTLLNLGRLGVGGGANVIETIADKLGVQNAEEIFNLDSEKVASAVGDFYAERYGSKESIEQTMRNDPLGFAADLAGLLTIVGGSARVGGTALSRVLPKTGSVVSKAGGTVGKIGAISDPANLVTKPVVVPFKLLGKSIRAMNNANIKSSLNLTRGQMKKITKMGKSPADFLSENNIIANNVDELTKSLADVHSNSYDEVNRALASVDQTFSKSNIEDLDAIIRELSDDFNKPGLKTLRDKAIKLVEKDDLSLTELNEAKRLIDAADFIFTKSGTEKAGFRAKGTGNIRSALKKFIEDKAAENGIDNIRELNKKTQISKGLIDEINEAADKFGDSGRFLSFRDVAYGLGGQTVGGPVGAFLTVVTERIAATPAVATRLNLILNSLSPSEFTAVKMAIETGKATDEARRVMQSILNAIESPQTLPAEEGQL